MLPNRPLASLGWNCPNRRAAAARLGENLHQEIDQTPGARSSHLA
jgi:hypothetical protein